MVGFGTRARTRAPLGCLHNAHAGATMLVCGCGPSLNELPGKPACLTIGVNDVGRHFDPDYLVVVNPRAQFPPERWQAIADSRARAVFSQYPDLPLARAPLVHITLGQYNGADFTRPDVLHYTQNSPYVALCLAIHMGARRIGLIGVDFTDNHFFGPTGRHPLAAQLGQINREYATLAAACARMGIEVFNLSSISRLTAFPRVILEKFFRLAGDEAASESGAMGPPTPGATSQSRPEPDNKHERNQRIFFVNYRFLTCGDVFTTGLRHAAEDLGIRSAGAYWDDPAFTDKVKTFRPDLLFVVHGRRFTQRVPPGLDLSSAVWLLDEPYEVDDTASWSTSFQTVFVNDPSTIGRHRNAYYLPAAFDPHTHFPQPGARKYSVGFVGGYNPSREATLLRLLDAGLLSYVVGGPWRAARLQRVCLAKNLPPEETAALYRHTKVVINVFRDQHHFNKNGIPGWSLNPRVYEALACGALVVSECRPEAERVFPTLPTFTDANQLVECVHSLLTNNSIYTSVLTQCQAGLADHTYAQRLRQALDTIRPGQVTRTGACVVSKPDPLAAVEIEPVSELPTGWCLVGDVATIAPGGQITLNTPDRMGAGCELGLASAEPFADVTLSFKMNLEANTWFVAKLHQLEQRDQTTNSYHLVCNNAGAYVAMHNHIFHQMLVPRSRWVTVEMSWQQGALRVVVDGRPLPKIRDDRMPSGYCFVGLKSGRVSLTNITLEGNVVPIGDRPGEVVVLGAREFPTVPGFSVLDETAIVSDRAYTDVELAFEASIDPRATLIAKLHQQDRIDLSSNSYHLVSRPEGAYFAKHNVLLSTLLVPHHDWCSIRIRRVQPTVELSINGQNAFYGVDEELQSGFCLLGASHGLVRMRNIHIRDLKAPVIADARPILKRVEHQRPLDDNLHTSGFTAMPRRNLIYHIWPVAGSLWKWNIEQLKQRIDLFNGRRIIGVVYDSKSVSSETVMSEFDGCGCEFVLLPNRDSGEVVTFAQMLQRIASHDQNEITFYGHAKGVKYGAQVSDAVRRWTEVLYRVTLDDWRSVWTHLKDHAMTGPFRMLGRFAAHRNSGDWHYSGAYFWMRHASVFARRDLGVPQFYGGVEAWPGKHFRISETGCLFLDNLRQLPYQPAFWHALGEPALARWEAALQTFPPPPDLEHPVPFSGFAWPRLEQKPDEMSWYLAQLLSADVCKLLTIGARHGGLEWHVARVFREQGRDIEITTIEIEPGQELMDAFADARERFGQSIHLVHADSTSSDVRQKLNGTYDAAFIDGDHSYRAACNDWLLARSMGARFIAFHDIVDSHWHAATRCCVSRLWNEIKADYHTEEQASGDWGGIGIVRV